MLADEAYIEEAIREPEQARSSKGFQPVMPELPFTDAEVQALVAYLKTLS